MSSSWRGSKGGPINPPWRVGEMAAMTRLSGSATGTRAKIGSSCSQAVIRISPLIGHRHSAELLIGEQAHLSGGSGAFDDAVAEIF